MASCARKHGTPARACTSVQVDQKCEYFQYSLIQKQGFPSWQRTNGYFSVQNESICKLFCKISASGTSIVCLSGDIPQERMGLQRPRARFVPDPRSDRHSGGYATRATRPSVPRDARGRPHLHLLKADSQFSLKAPDPTGTAGRQRISGLFFLPRPRGGRGASIVCVPSLLCVRMGFYLKVRELGEGVPSPALSGEVDPTESLIFGILMRDTEKWKISCPKILTSKLVGLYR